MGAILDGLHLGCRGAVGSTYNFSAPLYRRIIAAFDKGDIDTAQRDQAKSVEMVSTIAKYNYIPGAKAVMAIVGVNCGPARPPLRYLSSQSVANLEQDLKSIGFFDWA